MMDQILEDVDRESLAELEADGLEVSGSIRNRAQEAAHYARRRIIANGIRKDHWETAARIAYHDFLDVSQQGCAGHVQHDVVCDNHVGRIVFYVL